MGPTNQIPGYPNNHIAIEGPWQSAALNSVGVAADAFWQLGDTISTGKTHDDTNTIYYGSDEWTALVTNHIADIDAKYGSSSNGTASSNGTTA